MQAYQALLDIDADGDSADQLPQDNHGVPSWYPQHLSRERSGSRSRQASPNKGDTAAEKLHANDGLGLWWEEFSQPHWIGSGFPISSLDVKDENITGADNLGSSGHQRRKRRQAKASVRDPDIPGGFLQDAVARNIENLSRLRIEAQRLSSHVAALSDESVPPPALPEINLDDDFEAEELLVRSKRHSEGARQISEAAASQQLRVFVGALMGQNGFSGKLW